MWIWNAKTRIQTIQTLTNEKRLWFNENKMRVQRERYRLRVRASDRGEPPSHADVDVELDVVDRNNKPPIWDKSIYGPIHIKENVTVGTVVTSVKARLVLISSTKRNHKHKHHPITKRKTLIIWNWIRRLCSRKSYWTTK